MAISGDGFDYKMLESYKMEAAISKCVSVKHLLFQWSEGKPENTLLGATMTMDIADIWYIMSSCDIL